MKKTSLYILMAFVPLLISCSKNVELVIKSSKLETEISFHTEGQNSYFDDTDYNHINNYTGTGVVDESKSKTIEINWEVETNYKKEVVYTFTYSDNQNLIGSISRTTKDTKIELSNLKIDTTYYYQISTTIGKKVFNSDISSFKTSGEGLRNMNVSTLSNFRDLGGLPLTNGGRIKQGLIYRSAELNKSYTTNSIISADDINILKNDLKIKTEIDLRKVEESTNGIESGGITVSPLGEGVNYYSCPMVFGGTNVLTNEENLESIRAFFNILGNRNNYPVVFHCAQGKDRTGCLAYIIEAMLGADQDMMMRDYLFTNFSDVSGVCKENDIMGSTRVGGTIKNYTGTDLADKAYNYLIEELGINKALLLEMRSLLLDESYIDLDFES